MRPEGAPRSCELALRPFFEAATVTGLAKPVALCHLESEDKRTEEGEGVVENIYGEG